MKPKLKSGRHWLNEKLFSYILLIVFSLVGSLGLDMKYNFLVLNFSSNVNFDPIVEKFNLITSAVSPLSSVPVSPLTSGQRLFIGNISSESSLKNNESWFQ